MRLFEELILRNPSVIWELIRNVLWEERRAEPSCVMEYSFLSSITPSPVLLHFLLCIIDRGNADSWERACYLGNGDIEWGLNCEKNQKRTHMRGNRWRWLKSQILLEYRWKFLNTCTFIPLLMLIISWLGKQCGQDKLHNTVWPKFSNPNLTTLLKFGFWTVH